LANSINTDIATGVTGNTTANAALPKAGGTMTGSLICTAHSNSMTTTGNDDNLQLISTDADANVGPNLLLYRNSASPADGDVLGEITFDGRQDGGGVRTYASITGNITDASDATEDGKLVLKTISAGSQTTGLTINTGGVCELYHNGTKKLATSATGVTVTGVVAATTLTGDGSALTGISGGLEVAFAAHKTNGNQGYSQNTLTKVTFDSELIDVGGCYASDKFTVPSGQGGTYFFSASIKMGQIGGGGSAYNIQFYKNGSSIFQGVGYITTESEYPVFTASFPITLAATDYIEVYGISNGGGGNFQDEDCTFMGFKLG